VCNLGQVCRTIESINRRSFALKSAHVGSYNGYALSKKDRQEAFVVRAADQRLSQEQAIDQARLIPKSVVSQFKVVRWVR
jgi:hypothetical protein